MIISNILVDNNISLSLNTNILGMAAAVVPAITAYLRVKGGKHFYTDVITGYLVGAAVGLIVPELHKTDNRFSTGMAMLPNGQLGMGIYFVINTNL